VTAARRPVVGAAKVAGAIVGLMRKARGTLRVEAVVCNSAPAVLFYLDNRLEGVITVDVVDDKITNFYAVRNPDKLAALTTAREISRG
jgi:RNA polymerase sigma-70 factor (ECF subfamily)